MSILEYSRSWSSWLSAFQIFHCPYPSPASYLWTLTPRQGHGSRIGVSGPLLCLSLCTSVCVHVLAYVHALVCVCEGMCAFERSCLRHQNGQKRHCSQYSVTLTGLSLLTTGDRRKCTCSSLPLLSTTVNPRGLYFVNSCSHHGPGAYKHDSQQCNVNQLSLRIKDFPSTVCSIWPFLHNACFPFPLIKPWPVSKITSKRVNIDGLYYIKQSCK